jgi:hypothetical protein
MLIVGRTAVDEWNVTVILPQQGLPEKYPLLYPLPSTFVVGRSRGKSQQCIRQQVI